MKTRDELFIEFLLKELTEAVFKRELKGDDMRIIHRIIAKWRKENEVID